MSGSEGGKYDGSGQNKQWKSCIRLWPGFKCPYTEEVNGTNVAPISPFIHHSLASLLTLQI